MRIKFMCTVVLTRFVCLFICFWCYLQLWTEAPLVITLVSSPLVSPVPWHLGRSRFHLFVYGSSQKNDIIFLRTCLLPGHPLRYMCYPLWADHSLSVTGWFTSFYAKTEAFSWLKRQSWGKTRFNMKKFSKSEPLWNVGLPESSCWHHIAHTNVYGVIVPLIRRDVLGAPQQGRQVLAERDGLDLSRYQATRSLKYLLVSRLET